jgi:threonine synthase
MGRPIALECIRCGCRYSLADYAEDCRRCHGAAPSNLTVRYESELASLRREALGEGPSTLWRYAEALPVDAADAVSLGEGMTPLVRAPCLGDELGVRALYVKDESRNPTWSFKDRLASVGVSMARQLGARVIASSSSGNAGAAVAAYAARAGLPCIVFTFQGAAGPMVTQMRAYGAMVLAVQDKADRWTLLETGVRRFGWFPTSPFFAPAVGSNPFGIEGYKTLAYEIAEQLDWQAPDWCVLPVCYGDALYGMWKGFGELARLGWIATPPRMVAAEIFGSLGAALSGGGDVVPEMPKRRDTVAVSIAATRATYQALHALRASGGTARSVDDDELLQWQARLAATEGLYAEPSAAAPLAAVQRLRADGIIAADATVVTVATAGGLKDPSRTAIGLGEAPLVPPSIEAACEVLRETYGFEVSPAGGRQR